MKRQLPWKLGRPFWLHPSGERTHYTYPPLPGDHEGCTRLQMQDFIRRLRSGEGPSITAAEGKWATLAGLAAERALRERRWVSVSELEDDKKPQ